MLTDVMQLLDTGVMMSHECVCADVSQAMVTSCNQKIVGGKGETGRQWTSITGVGNEEKVKW